MMAASELPDYPATLKAMLLAERARASRLEQIIKELQRHRWQLGGEGSGHLLVLDKHTTGDGLVSALQVLQACVRSGQTVSELLAGLTLFPQTLLGVRIARLRGDRAHSQQVPSVGQHVLQLPRLLSSDNGLHTLHTPFTYAESRGEDLVVLHGHCLHRLRETPDGLRIVLKRVNLVNAHSRLPMIQLFP